MGPEDQTDHQDELDYYHDMAELEERMADQPPDLLAALKALVAVVEDEPEYHQQGMGCGLEDRAIHDRYEAMAYGWDQGVFRCRELLDEPLGQARAAIAKATKGEDDR